MAPGATLYLAERLTTAADLRAAVDWFKSKGVRIISRSQGPLAWTGRETAPGRSLDVVAPTPSPRACTWFNSAGNTASDTRGPYDRARYFRQAVVRHRRRTGGWTSARPGDEYLGFTCSSQHILKGLRWSDWGRDPKTDYDVVRCTRTRTNGHAALPVERQPDHRLQLPMEDVDGTRLPGGCTARTSTDVSIGVRPWARAPRETCMEFDDERVRGRIRLQRGTRPSGPVSGLQQPRRGLHRCGATRGTAVIAPVQLAGPHQRRAHQAGLSARPRTSRASASEHSDGLQRHERSHARRGGRGGGRAGCQPGGDACPAGRPPSRPSVVDRGRSRRRTSSSEPASSLLPAPPAPPPPPPPPPTRSR